MWGPTLFLFATGAAIGSFLNVVVYRLPRKISLISPRSHCPACKTPVPLVGLVPVFGYAFVRGCCKACHTRVSLEYPVVEALCGASTLALFFFHVHFSPNLFHPVFFVELALSLWIFYVGLTLALIDIHTHRLPNEITLPGILISFAFSIFAPSLGLKLALLGLAVACLLSCIIILFFRWFSKNRAFGIGDVKYFLLVGAALGPKGFVVCGLFAAFFATIYSLVFRRQSLPFAPCIALGSLVGRIVIYILK